MSDLPPEFQPEEADTPEQAKRREELKRDLAAEATDKSPEG